MALGVWFVCVFCVLRTSTSMGRAPERILQTITTTQNNAPWLESSQTRPSLMKWHHLKLQFWSEAKGRETPTSPSLSTQSQSSLQVGSSAMLFIPVYSTACFAIKLSRLPGNPAESDVKTKLNKTKQTKKPNPTKTPPQNNTNQPTNQTKTEKKNHLYSSPAKQ